jgi:hypothetical protein
VLRGSNLIFFSLHLLYYAPLGSWLGLPFFKPDSELVFAVLWPGRVLAAFVYAAVWIGFFRLFRAGGRQDENRVRRTRSRGFSRIAA